MSVHITLPLFAGVGHELEEGAEVVGRQLRDLGTRLQERLVEAGDLVDRLRAEGWTCRVGLYDILLRHEKVETHDEAVRRLRAAGADPERLMIVEEVEDVGE
jgi:hypothetical protein